MKKGNGMYPRLRARATELGLNYEDIAVLMSRGLKRDFPQYGKTKRSVGQIAKRFEGKVAWSITEAAVLCDILRFRPGDMLDEFFGEPREYMEKVSA